MTEYIERDVVIDDIGDLFTICYETLPNECGHHFIVEKELQTHLDFVRNLPAADVVEVIRCKDCGFWYVPKLANGEKLGACGWWSGNALVRSTRAEDYCSRGIRKEGQR